MTERKHLKDNNSPEKMVEEELEKHHLTLDIILEGNLDDVIELCKENNFPPAVKIHLIKAFKAAKAKDKNQKKTKVNVESFPEPSPKDKVKPKTKANVDANANAKAKAKTTSKKEELKKPKKKKLTKKVLSRKPMVQMIILPN